MSDRTDNGQTLERYLAILDVYAGLRPSDAGPAIPGKSNLALGVMEISRALGLSKGTVSRYLHRLEQAGVLTRLPDRRYTLATRVYHWGQAAIPMPDLRAQARPVMEDLAERFGETVSLFILERDATICIAQVEGHHLVRLSASVGRRRPLHIGASPRLLLAFAPEEQQEWVLSRNEFPALTPATITTADALRRALAETREQGYVISAGESNEGVTGIAAPIRDDTGDVCAAISIAGPDTRVRGERRDEIIAALLKAVEQISRSLGHMPSPMAMHVQGVGV
jgi:DNA-binding IclR family transcriptional regulator